MNTFINSKQANFWTKVLLKYDVERLSKCNLRLDTFVMPKPRKLCSHQALKTSFDLDAVLFLLFLHQK